MLRSLKNEYKDPQFRTAYYRHLAICHTKRGEYEDADYCISVCTEKYTRILSVRTLEVESLLQRGDLVRAEEKLVSLFDDFQIDANHKRFFQPFMLASRFFKITGDYETSREYLLKARRVREAGGAALNQSIAFLDEQLSVCPVNRAAGLTDYVTYLRRMKHTRIAQGDRTLATTFLETFIRQNTDPDRLLTCHNLAAICYLDINNLAKAKLHIDRALAINDEDSHANGAMILYHLAKKDIPSAREHFSASAISILRSPRVSTSLFHQFRDAGDPETSARIADMQRARKSARRTHSMLLDVSRLENQ